jgi:hypothetical protein
VASGSETCSILLEGSFRHVVDQGVGVRLSVNVVKTFFLPLTLLINKLVQVFQVSLIY